MKKILALIGITSTLAVGAVDASSFNLAPLPEQAADIAGNRVSVKQTGNIVETTLPWKDQSGIKVKYDMGEPSVAEKLVDKRDVQAFFKVKNPEEFEFGLSIRKKQKNSTFCYDIDTKDYDWFKQPPLTQEEIDEGAFRPENVVNSFAVYHKTKKNNEYETGKAFHRYRAEAVDASGNRIWATDSNIVGNKVCDEFDTDWFNSADYPVTI